MLWKNLKGKHNFVYTKDTSKVFSYYVIASMVTPEIPWLLVLRVSSHDIHAHTACCTIV